MRPSRDIIIGISALIILSGIVVWFLTVHITVPPPQNVSSSQQTEGTSTSAVATSTESTSAVAAATAAATAASRHTAERSSVNPQPIDQSDTILSWKLSVIESTTTAAHLQTEIKTLIATIGTGRYSSYNLYTQIAQDYELLGNGRKAYDFYVRAAENNPAKGLAFNNIGNLMERIGAYYTASDAYAKAVALEPKIELYWLGYLNFLAAHKANDPATAAVFTKARRATNNAPDVLISAANWEASIGNTSAAIADWQLVRPHVGPEQQKAIDIKIATLQKK